MTDKARAARQRTCFVIGPIGAAGTDTRKQADFLLSGIIREVLEKSSFDYRVQRADSVSEPGMISDQVITEVSEADLVIADLSEHNPNAFYELAIRHMEEKPVIHMICEGYDIPFDIKDYRLIQFDLTDWQKIEKSREDLRKQIKAIQKSDYVVSNPITKARGRTKLRESSDSRDSIIADLVHTISALGERVSKIENQRPDTPIGKALRRQLDRNRMRAAARGVDPDALDSLFQASDAYSRKRYYESLNELFEDLLKEEDPPEDNGS